MKITLAEWLVINQKVTAVRTAQAVLEQQLLMIAANHRGNTVEVEFLMNFDSSRWDSHMTAPQSEWMGGLTSGPGSETTKTYLREPHCVEAYTRYVLNDCQRPRYFTAEEVEEARQNGLLLAGGDVTGPPKT